MSDVTGLTYADTDAFVGFGTELKVGLGNGSPETFVSLKSVKSIKLGKMSANVVERTHLRSPNRHREKIATIRDSEPITVVCNWNPTHGSQSNAGGDGFTNGGMLALHRDLTENNFICVLSNGTSWPFRGIVTGFDPGELGIETVAEVTFEITPVADSSDELP